MGLDYGYDIYLRPRNVARALTAVAELAPPSRDVPPLDVTLPGGDRVVLPFTSGFGSEPVVCSTGGVFRLDTSLMFGVDEAVRAYGESSGLPPEVNGRVQIGYVYLAVRYESFLHPGYASLEFWAATSGMSRLFARSASIRKTFTDLTAAVGGVCCLFDTGDGGPEEVCWLNGEATRVWVGGARFPDQRALVATWPDAGVTDSLRAPSAPGGSE
ncbi:hypothetical protein ACFUVV_11675 [Streptomyces sp. NPDC057376]|uniref:hypothetical protein n=1 Tax=Streptomyces sp. NPDC057376 TaxID=3346110 RepID=UPI00362C73FD